jgi:hypothetical protein
MMIWVCNYRTNQGKTEEITLNGNVSPLKDWLTVQKDSQFSGVKMPNPGSEVQQKPCSTKVVIRMIHNPESPFIGET